MKGKSGERFSIANENQPVAGCTISREVLEGVVCFSLAENTDISAEIYPYRKLVVVCDGALEVYGIHGKSFLLNELDAFVSPADIPIGMRSASSAVYIEIMVRRNDTMNNEVKPGEVFALKDLVPYQDGRIVNMDIVHNEKMKFVVMSLCKGTSLGEHAAPGEAIVFALDGEGVIGYEGKEHRIKAGENFHFAKGGLHSVRATENFKMALLLTLED